ncbi:E3 ubiquitin-protein ligase CHIP [Sclerotinia borealis F-4128]|uniref:E3 ubiquitin-protein ligase CHIP n=1 Tax=Sclerotinia borealis (strain F-4128) TaxID=1432307 RepID=W9C5B7_SCLBF|nr:E3 ubiquitin-protein ligase CHIP [Sclerotinia borealis F-4128]
MAGSDLPSDPPGIQKAFALDLKKRGNEHFQSGNFEAAEVLYRKAITFDPRNPLLYTNHAKALLKLTRYPEAITASREALQVMALAKDGEVVVSVAMKAHYHVAQGMRGLGEYEGAMREVQVARGFCEKGMETGEGDTGKSLKSILELGLRCRREGWEIREEKRRRERRGLEGEVLGLMRREGNEGGEKGMGGWESKIEEVERVFRLVETQGKEGRRREMPDWAIDGISFNVMIDPVMTKTGQSYERSSILQHLERSNTDPLTREVLRKTDLRPNLGLRCAIEEFLEENGWAVEW